MSDQMDGSWCSGKRYAAGGTLTAPTSRATILTALSRAGYSPGPTLMPTPVQTIPLSLGYPASAERSVVSTCAQATASQPRTACTTSAGSSHTFPVKPSHRWLASTRQGHASRVRTARISGPRGSAVWQVSR
jgi:hypothetical protein